MDEPMQGVVFIIESIQINKDHLESTNKSEMEETVDYGPFGGQLIGTIKTLCKRSFLNSDPRVVEAMYKCSMQASPETYGVVYNVINQVRGRVIEESVQEGTNFFLIDALIPINEGFLFTNKIRQASSGIAHPQLVFHGFEVNIDNDPFFIPKTIDDLEEHGQGDILTDNIAKKIIEKVRQQKGLSISRAVVAEGEK